MEGGGAIWAQYLFLSTSFPASGGGNLDDEMGRRWDGRMGESCIHNIDPSLSFSLSLLSFSLSSLSSNLIPKTFSVLWFPNHAPPPPHNKNIFSPTPPSLSPPPSHFPAPASIPYKLGYGTNLSLSQIQQQ